MSEWLIELLIITTTVFITIAAVHLIIILIKPILHKKEKIEKVESKMESPAILHQTSPSTTPAVELPPIITNETSDEFWKDLRKRQK